MNVILFIFGMGRSGSSALTRVLSLCGGTLPADLLGANEGNPLGHWEPKDAVSLNDAFLSGHGTSWFDPTLRLQGEIAFSGEERTAFRNQIKSFLGPLATAPVLLIKEPRITALSALWFEAARQLGLSVRIVIPVRHPAEVVASLAARDGTPPELSSALWLKYNLLAERESRSYPRVFVQYESLLHDWRAEVVRIGAALSLHLSMRDELSVDRFLRQDLRRQRHDGEIYEPFGRGWLSRAYAALSTAARDEPLDPQVLDEIFDAYRSCERGFRLALAGLRGGFAPRSPNIAKLICAVAGSDSLTLKACLNSSWYRDHNPDIFSAGRDPYEHWIAYGSAEGRLPCDDPLALLDLLMSERINRPAIPPARVPAGPQVDVARAS
jgi:hypothetical protein